MGFLCTKAELFKGKGKKEKLRTQDTPEALAELFKVIQSVWGIYRASHTKKNGVKDNFLGLQALTKNFMLFSRGL